MNEWHVELLDRFQRRFFCRKFLTPLYWLVALVSAVGSTVQADVYASFDQYSAVPFHTFVVAAILISPWSALFVRELLKFQQLIDSAIHRAIHGIPPLRTCFYKISMVRNIMIFSANTMIFQGVGTLVAALWTNIYVAFHGCASIAAGHFVEWSVHRFLSLENDTADHFRATE